MIALARDRATLTAAAALAGASAVAWIGLAGYDAPMGPAGFVAAWTLMMAAMMLPSIAPLVLLYRGPRVLLAGGYLFVWAAVGLVAWALMEAVEPRASIVLVLAGAYELTPMKTACLHRCRGPADFLMAHYRSGPLRLGVQHGAWCIGCCVGLMAVLVLAAAMSLAWAAVIAAAVFVQKVLPHGEAAARATGFGLLVAGIAVEVT